LSFGIIAPFALCGIILSVRRKLAEAQDIKIAIPIDTSYTFGRSYLLKDDKWERLGKGKFMIWLELESK
jgi:hypothetical protein